MLADDAQFSQDDSPGENPLLEQARRDLERGGAERRGLDQLARDIAEEPGADCDEYRGALDIYIDAELNGRDVQRAYPGLWLHLQSCAECRRDYDELIDVLSRTEEAERAAAPALTLQPLTFLKRKDFAARWFSHIRSQLEGASFGLHIRLSPGHLRDRLSGASALRPARAYRSDSLQLSSEPRTLVVDDLAFGEQRLNVQIQAIPATEPPDRVTLHASLTSTAALPENLQLRLDWDGQSFEAPVNRTNFAEGYAQIEGIPYNDPDDDARFEFIFEVRDVQTDDDDTALSD